MQVILTCLVTLVLVVGTVRGKSSIVDYFELRKSREVLQQTVTKLDSDVKRMELEILKIKESKSYALKILRDKYHVTEEHENIIFYAE